MPEWVSFRASRSRWSPWSPTASSAAGMRASEPQRRASRMKLHVLDLGRMRMDSRVLIDVGPSPFPAQVEVPISAYCIEHPDCRVLFDTGCHPQAMGPNGRWTQEFQRDYPHLGGGECTLPYRL